MSERPAGPDAPVRRAGTGGWLLGALGIDGAGDLRMVVNGMVVNGLDTRGGGDP